MAADHTNTSSTATVEADLYRVGATAAPVLGGFGGVTDADLARYDQQGFLAIANAFSPREVEDAAAAVDAIFRDPARASMVTYEAGVKPEDFASAEERYAAARKVFNFLGSGDDDGLSAMARHPGMLGLVERLLEGPAEVYQDMALLKPAYRGREKPWHQDHAYFRVPTDTRVVGVWIALDEATVENGCMHVMPGWHRKGPVVHFARRDWQLCDDDVEGTSCTAVPLQPGGCLVFDSYLPHGTPTNRSPRGRRSVQYHYCPRGARRVSNEDRMTVFGSEGKDVSC